MPTIALTGATGFVGRQVLRRLQAAGYNLRVFVHSENDALASLESEAFEIVRTSDLFSEPLGMLRDNLEDIDTLIHCAWYTEPGKYLTSPLNIDCLIGTLRLAQAFQAAKGRRFVGIGTCFEYDLDRKTVDTKSPLQPASLYAACKVSTFQTLRQMFISSDSEFAWCRLFYLFGEGEDQRRLVPYLHKQLSGGLPAQLSSGKQIRDYLDVGDAASMIVEAATGRRQGPLNICSGIPISIRELAEQIADLYGRRDLLQFGTRPDNLIDPTWVVGVKEQNLHE